MHIDHPAGQMFGVFRRCRPGKRCGVCSFLMRDPDDGRALFEVMLALAEDLPDRLARLERLFPEAA